MPKCWLRKWRVEILERMAAYYDSDFSWEEYAAEKGTTHLEILSVYMTLFKH